MVVKGPCQQLFFLAIHAQKGCRASQKLGDPAAISEGMFHRPSRLLTEREAKHGLPTCGNAIQL